MFLPVYLPWCASANVVDAELHIISFGRLLNGRRDYCRSSEDDVRNILLGVMEQKTIFAGSCEQFAIGATLSKPKQTPQQRKTSNTDECMMMGRRECALARIMLAESFL